MTLKLQIMGNITLKLIIYIESVQLFVSKEEIIYIHSTVLLQKLQESPNLKTSKYKSC